MHNKKKSILYTLEEANFGNKKLLSLVDQVEKEKENFQLYSVIRYKDEYKRIFIEVLFQVTEVMEKTCTSNIIPIKRDLN